MKHPRRTVTTLPRPLVMKVRPLNITLPVDIAGPKPDSAWFATVVDMLGIRDRCRTAQRTLGRAAAAGRLRPDAGRDRQCHGRATAKEINRNER
jgi:hypothetical protein